MDDRWFKSRGPDEGVGYGIANWKGLLATVCFILFTILAVVLPIRVFGLTWTSFGVGVGGFLVGLMLFLPLIRARSD